MLWKILVFATFLPPLKAEQFTISLKHFDVTDGFRHHLPSLPCPWLGNHPGNIKNPGNSDYRLICYNLKGIKMLGLGFIMYFVQVFHLVLLSIFFNLILFMTIYDFLTFKWFPFLRNQKDEQNDQQPNNFSRQQASTRSKFESTDKAYFSARPNVPPTQTPRNVPKNAWGMQRLHPIPRALWSAHSTAMTSSRSHMPKRRSARWKTLPATIAS